MLSKFSVKKPFTVWVGVVLILIVGIVSITRMSTDLLPNMNFPYSIVYTTYIGANPEEVEETVTRPVESAMSKVANIKKVQSISSDNLSLVILQFEEDTNMDSANLEMRENLDAIKGQWKNSNIGSPSYMNINPDMLPVMIAAIDYNEYEGAKLNDYVNDNLLTAFESIDGVAQVSSSGGIVESVSVTLSKEKADKVNALIKDALDGKFADAKSQIANAKNGVNSGISGIDSGLSQINAAKSEIANKQAEINSQMISAKASSDSALMSNLEMRVNITNQISDLLSKKSDLTEEKELLNDPEYIKDLDPEKVAARLVEIDTAIRGLDSTISGLNDTLSALEEGKIQIEEAKKQLDLQMSSANYSIYSSLADIASNSATLNSTKSSLQSGMSTIESNEKTLNSTINSTYEKLNIEKLIDKALLGQMLVAQNFSMPAGYVTDDNDSKILVRVGDKISSVDNISNLVVLDLGLDGLDPIKLSDIADVELTDNSSETYAKINGNDGILLTFDKQTGFSTGDVADSIKDKFASLEEANPGMHFTPLMDQGIYIDYIIESIFSNLLWGALFAIVILIFFLKSVKPTIIIAVSIPVSILTAIVLMYFTNISINIISLSGLALAVGMLVDNSIVVIENIYRLRSEGVPLLKACVDGSKQVAGAIIASTITTCCVFIPIIFATGITRQLFTDLALTVTFSLAASLLVALTLVPAMSSGLLKNVPEKQSKFVEKLKDIYGKTIALFLNHKAIIILVALVLLLTSGFIAYKKGTSFMPQMESTQVSLTIKAPEGVSFEDATKLGDEVVSRISDIEDIETIGVMAGSSGVASLMSMGSNDKRQSISTYIILSKDKKLSNSEIKQEILDRTADLDCELSISNSSADMTSLAGNGVTVVISGTDLEKLTSLATDFSEKLEALDGIEKVQSGIDNMTPEFKITVNKDEASKHNLTVATVFTQINKKLAESTTSTTLTTEQKDLDVIVYDEKVENLKVDDIQNMDIEATDSEGKTITVKLSDIASFETKNALSSIRRDSQKRTLNVKADVKDGYNIGNIGNDVQKIIDDTEIPEGYAMTLAGQNEMINDALSDLILMLILGIIFVYLVMVAQFQSLKMPFIIMFTIPLAFTGGFIGLIIGNMDISVVSLIGFVILVGVIVNNGIVLVDYINQLRLGGMEKREAIIEAGKTRLRPILMTAITTILGLSMMAFGVGMGSDMIQPLAVVTIGGMIYGTLMTLWIVPVVYDVISGKKELKNKEV